MFFNEKKSVSYGRYGNTGCWVFKREVQNWKDFCSKYKHTQRKYWIGVMGGAKNWTSLLEIKWFRYWCYQKMQITMLFFHWYKFEKDSDDFWHRKLTLKVKSISHFDRNRQSRQSCKIQNPNPHYTNSQNFIIFSGYVDF